MFLFLVAVVATVAARPQHGHQQKHNHGHVFLPQHILLHQTTNVKLSTAPIEKHKNNRQDVLIRHGEHNSHRGGKVGPHHKPKERLDPTSSSKSIQQPIEKETEKESEKYDVPTSLQPDIHIPSRTTIIIMQPESDYELGDPYIAEKKTQKTSSNKAVVKGIYSLDQPDDSVKIAEYTDKKSGFIFQIFPRLIQNQRDII
ncbi:uncharacterized protein LOC118262035 isoform X1 [Spodoptera frugiperda]|uniref:Uncharacterized protein LOC118262035 isoform X1 n=1 Tax=Spodoptera frugiperda TaxID=7108 RepID=A0A9R0CTN4_SPOFR|nr:uncharacterized protein LOC118262035 isoform X1 [Spodoptera frugiperda]